MPVQKSYKIVRSTNLEELQDGVNKLLALGYVLYGDLVVNTVLFSQGAAISDQVVTFFYQALTRKTFI